MVDTWQPAGGDTTEPDLTVLKTLASLHQQLEISTDLSAAIDEQNLARARSWIQLAEDQWQTVINEMEQQERLDLATFYTVAEMKLSGWEARDKNPAIWIYRFLKKTKQLPEKDIIKALKGKTDNRFIPYGSVL